MQRALSAVLRTAGQALDRAGRAFELHPHTDKLIPAATNVSYRKVRPDVNGNFVAPSATLVGQVSIGKNASVWYSAIVRGDVNGIAIGENTIIGDRAVVHVTRKNPTKIGSGVIVQGGAMVHGAELQDGCVVGSGAIVLDGAVVEKNAVLAAGAMLAPGKRVPKGQLWEGIPAKYVRDITPEETAAYSTSVQEQIMLADAHAGECAKPWEVIETERELADDEGRRAPHYFQRLTEQQLQQKDGYVRGNPYPGRVFNSEISPNKQNHL